MDKSQNVNPYSPTLKFTLGIIQIIIEACQQCFGANILSHQKYTFSTQVQ